MLTYAMCLPGLLRPPWLKLTTLRSGRKRFGPLFGSLRGWTLQELLAPHKVAFDSSTWNEIGSKAPFWT